MAGDNAGLQQRLRGLDGVGLGWRAWTAAPLGKATFLNRDRRGMTPYVLPTASTQD